MKLKTLKEIELATCEYGCTCDSDFCKDRVKEEVIKWIKEIRKSKEEDLNLDDADVVFKSFFNINEEELK